MQGHLVHFNLKPPLVKPSYKYKVKMPKVGETAMSSEISTMLLEETVDYGKGNKGIVT